MKRYLGIKQVNAAPMNREEYNEFRGWQVPDNENPDDTGYLVEYVDGSKANTDKFQGYVSWSPKDVFERAYRPMEGMTFGLAIEAVKRSAKVTRLGWNGKGLWIALSCAACREVSAENFWSPANADFARTRGGSAIVRPYLTMKTAEDQIVPWVASQSDILAEDWEVVE